MKSHKKVVQSELLMGSMPAADNGSRDRVPSFGHSLSYAKLPILGFPSPHYCKNYTVSPYKNNQAVIQQKDSMVKYIGYPNYYHTQYYNTYNSFLLLWNLSLTETDGRRPRPSNGKFRQINTQHFSCSTVVCKYVYTASYIVVTVCCQLREPEDPTHCGRG